VKNCPTLEELVQNDFLTFGFCSQIILAGLAFETEQIVM
jgi:hypothetical protein